VEPLTPTEIGHLTSQDVANWLAGVCQESELLAMQAHCLFCAECREQVALVSQAIGGWGRTGDDPDVGLLPQLGEEAARHVRNRARSLDAAPDTDLREHRPNRIRLSDMWLGRRAWFWGLAVASLVVIAGYSTWYLLFRQTSQDRGLLALQRAYRKQRPLEVRITGFSYAPFPKERGVPGGEKADEKIDYLALDRAKVLLFGLSNKNADSATAHAISQYYLTQKEFAKASDQLKKALEQFPDDARLHSDLGAALFEMGKSDRQNKASSKSLEEFAQSLEHLNRALEINNHLAEALFNRALLYQEMQLPEQAQEDFRRYLKEDLNSPWAGEANDHLKELEQKRTGSLDKDRAFQNFLEAFDAKDDELAWDIIRHNREPLAGRDIAERLIKEFLDLSAGRHKKEAGLRLAALTYVADLEARKLGDGYTAGLAQFYKLLPHRKMSALARANALMGVGHLHYTKAQYGDAITAYARAKQAFSLFGDKWEVLIAEYWVGYTAMVAAKPEQSLSTFKRLARVCRKEHYTWLHMRTLASFSSAHFNLNDYSEAIRLSAQSLNMAEEAGDAIGVFNALSFLTEYYRYVGNYPMSLECIIRSLPYLDTCPLNPLQKWRHYSIIASSLNSAGFYQFALDYQKEVVKLALAADNFSMVSVSYAHMGLIFGKLGNFSEAIREASLAHETAKPHAEGSAGQKVMAYASLQLGNLYRQLKDYDSAVKSYSESIELYEKLDFPTHLYQAHKGRAFCYIARGDNSLAGGELKTALGLLEHYRSKIVEEGNRNNFFDLEQSIYDLAINFEYSRMDDSMEAYEYSEASRARSLLDLMRQYVKFRPGGDAAEVRIRAASHPLTLGSIRQRLPGKVQILQFAVLEDRLLSWVVSRDCIHLEVKRIAQQDLERKVRQYLESISSASSEENLDVSKELFNILISPVERWLSSNKQVFVVPDKALSYLPFGLLFSASRGKYLLEDYCIAYAPSSTVVVLCSEEARKKEAVRAERLLSVGNPDFDRGTFPSLLDLPSAVREAEEIVAFYPYSSFLVGDKATKSTVMSEMMIADVIHFASHAVLDEQSPLRSRLVLARNQTKDIGYFEDSDTLSAREIYGMFLPKTRLVVLSACQTGSSRYFKGEGMVSIARPFIAARVPVVVASLWPVDSDATEELMISFHEHRKKKNVSTVEALRQAQLAMLNAPGGHFRHPYFWAPFIVIGGYARF